MDAETRALIEALQRKLGAGRESPTVNEIWEKYAEWGPRNIANWKQGQRIHWGHLQSFWGERRVGDLTLADADAYRVFREAQGKNKGSTRNREMSSMRACFTWAAKRRLIPYNPLAGMEQEPESKGRTEFVDEAGFQRLAGCAPNPLARALFIIAFDTGMRRGELCDLVWDAVDLEARLIRLGDGDVKNGTGRIVPLTDRAVETMRELPRWSRFVFSYDGGTIAKSTANDWFRAARKKAGLPDDFKFHSLRHSAATLMRRRGVPWPLIKSALGWKTDVAARRYQQYSEADWSQLRALMNAGITEETRRPPLRAMPRADESHPTAHAGDAKNSRTAKK